MTSGGSANTALSGGISPMQSTTPPVQALPVGQMSPSEFKQMNNGWSQSDMDNFGRVKEGAKGISDAASAYGKSMSEIKGPKAIGWQPNQGYQFARDLYTIKR